MKIRVLIIVFLFLSHISLAQMTFSPIGTTYNYSTKNSWSESTHKVYMGSEKDTIIKGRLFRKLKATEVKKEFMGIENISQFSILARENKDSIFINGYLYYLGGKVKDTIPNLNANNYLVFDSIGQKNIFGR